MPGLRIFRCLRPPFVHDVRIGPSWAKIPLDFCDRADDDPARVQRALRRRALARGRQLHRHRRGGGPRRAAPLRHALEPAAAAQQFCVLEVAAPAWARSRSWSGSSSADRKRSSSFVRSSRRPCAPSMRTCRLCSSRTPRAPAMRRRKGRALTSASDLGLAADTPIVLYTGTFEAYQGLDLLFAAAQGRSGEDASRAFRPCRRPARSDRAPRSSRCEPRAWPSSLSLPVSGRRKRFPTISTRPMCSCRRAATARTRR